MEKSNTAVAAMAFLVGIAVLAMITVYPIVAARIDDATLNNMALTSLGGILGVVAAGGAWFMRGRTERQTGDGTGDGTTTVIPPAGTSSRTTVETTADPGKSPTLSTPLPPS